MDYSKVYGDFYICDKNGRPLSRSYDNLQDAIDQINQIDILRMVGEDVYDADGVLYANRHVVYSLRDTLTFDIGDGINIYFHNAYYDKWRTYLNFNRSKGTELTSCVYTLELRNRHYYGGIESVENKHKLEFDGIYNLFRQLYKEEYIEEYTTEEYGTYVINDKGILFKDKYLCKYNEVTNSFEKWARLDFMSEKIAICYKEDDDAII